METVEIDVIKKDESEVEKPTAPVDRVLKPLKKVFVRCGIYAMRNVDTINQSFFCDLFLELGWHDPKYDGMKLPTDEAELEKFTTSVRKELPVRFKNVIIENRREVWVALGQRGTHQSNVRLRMRVEATFTTKKFRLRNFPFDMQELEISIISDMLTETELELIANEAHPNVIDTDPHTSTQNLSEWKVAEYVESIPSQSNGENSASGLSYPMFTFRVLARRKWRYYFWNVYFMLFLLVTMAGTAFSTTDFSFRVSTIITLVLAVVTFKLTVSQLIPRISYITSLDRYVLISFAFLSIAVLNAGISSFIHVNHADIIFLIVIASCWAFYNLVEIFNAIHTNRMNIKEMHKVNALKTTKKTN